MNSTLAEQTTNEPTTCPRAARLHGPLRYCPDCPEGDQCELQQITPTQPTAEQLRLARECAAKAVFAHFSSGVAEDALELLFANGSRDQTCYVQSALLAIQATEARMAAAVEWQDIATAPRDGTQIIAVYGVEFDPVVDLIEWHEGAWWTDGDYWRLELGQPQKTHGHWTHWHPVPALPAPPTIRSQSNG